MITKLIKLDQKNNFLFNSKTDEFVDKYDHENPDLKLVIKLDDDSILTVNAEKIKIGYGNQIVVDYNDTRFIIDDGYQDILIKAGYIVYMNYDTENILDREVGIEVRDDIHSRVVDSITNVLLNDLNVSYDTDNNSNDSTLIFIKDNYQYTVVVDTINSIVSKNQERRDNSLPFYPFTKDMDKYGAMYISIFAKKIAKIENDVANTKYKTADELIKNIILKVGPEYHYVNQRITKRLIRTPKGI